MSAVVTAEALFMCIYLVNQKAWLGRRERAFLYGMIALATLFQTLVYGGTSYGTPGIAVRMGPAGRHRRAGCGANGDSPGAPTKCAFPRRGRSCRACSSRA